MRDREREKKREVERQRDVWSPHTLLDSGPSTHRVQMGALLPRRQRGEERLSCTGYMGRLNGFPLHRQEERKRERERGRGGEGDRYRERDGAIERERKREREGEGVGEIERVREGERGR